MSQLPGRLRVTKESTAMYHLRVPQTEEELEIIAKFPEVFETYEKVETVIQEKLDKKKEEKRKKKEALNTNNIVEEIPSEIDEKI